MPPEELTFEEFLASRMRDKGLTLKRLSEATGIAPTHLENMLHGNFDEMPSTPYFRGYVIRLGKILEFNGEEWWGRIKQASAIKNAGPSDALPQNRFIKKKVPKLLWLWGAIAVIIVIYLVVTIPHIIGKPTLSVVYPPASPYTTGANTITLGGAVADADVLYLSNGNASDSEEIPIATDGSWQKTVLLQDGLNTFELSAKKLLGGETDVMEQIIYQGPVVSSTATSTPSSTVPATPSPTPSPTAGISF
ncbi:MAG TPA: helix-turn-helix domain-containing protein [Candidatus Paceibacterota bacterium]|jgi:cytoskeletal protein RodZ|nr:helix-turn-helix domain-containing protein [Candidatus Paceibacterota bacterium]